MRLLTLITPLAALLSSTLGASDSNLTTPLTSRQILPSNFKPPQVFRNVNLLRNINLEKAYVRETVNVVIENVDSKPQDQYYLPFDAEVVEKLGGIEIRDKKDVGKGNFQVDTVEYDTYRLPSRFLRFLITRLYQTDKSQVQRNSTVSRSPHPSLPPTK